MAPLDKAWHLMLHPLLASSRLLRQEAKARRSCKALGEQVISVSSGCNQSFTEEAETWKFMDDRMEENAANVSNCKTSWREFHTLKLQGEAPGEHFKLFLGGVKGFLSVHATLRRLLNNSREILAGLDSVFCFCFVFLEGCQCCICWKFFWTSRVATGSLFYLSDLVFKPRCFAKCIYKAVQVALHMFVREFVREFVTHR